MYALIDTHNSCVTLLLLPSLFEDEVTETQLHTPRLCSSPRVAVISALYHNASLCLVARFQNHQGPVHFQSSMLISTSCF